MLKTVYKVVQEIKDQEIQLIKFELKTVKLFNSTKLDAQAKQVKSFLQQQPPLPGATSEAPLQANPKAITTTPIGSKLYLQVAKTPTKPKEQ